jgi:hypothetical protein
MPKDDTHTEDTTQALAEDIQEAIDEHTGSDDDEDVDEEDELDDDDLKDEDMEKDKACSKPVRKTFPIIKELGDQQIVYGVVSEPDTVDLQGDRLSKAEIRKACHKFMIESQQIGKEHRGPAKADIIESNIAPVAFKCNGQVVRKGSWVMAVKVHDQDLWQAVKSGDINGFSIAGRGNRIPF